MTQNKEEIIADMLANGLLSKEDAERYLADKFVSADEMEEIKRLILLCQKRAESKSKSYSLEEADEMIREKYFNNPSESMADDKEYTKQLIQLCEKSQREIDNGQEYSIDEVFDRIKQKYSTTESMTDDTEYIKQLIQLCDNNQKYIDTGQTRPIEELFNEVEEKYFSEQSDESMTDSVRVGDDYSKAEQEAIEAIIRRGDEDMKNGRYMSEEEFYREIGLDLSPPSKSQTLKELLSQGDITQKEYEKYLSDDNFSDADAMEMKAIEDIIRRGEEDLENGNVESWEDTLKKIQEARKRILADDDEAIRRCEEDIKNGRLYTEEEAIEKIKKD